MVIYLTKVYIEKNPCNTSVKGKNQTKGLGKIIWSNEINKNVLAVYKSDLIERQKDYKKHYSKDEDFICDKRSIYKKNKCILTYNEGIPYAWTSKDNVYKSEN